MTVQRETIQDPRTGATPGQCPQPVSLETIALVEQVLRELLRDLRARLASRSTPDAGTIEYESWMRRARH